MPPQPQQKNGRTRAACPTCPPYRGSSQRLRTGPSPPPERYPRSPSPQPTSRPLSGLFNPEHTAGPTATPVHRVGGRHAPTHHQQHPQRTHRACAPTTPRTLIRVALAVRSPGAARSSPPNLATPPPSAPPSITHRHRTTNPNAHHHPVTINPPLPLHPLRSAYKVFHTHATCPCAGKTRALPSGKSIPPLPLVCAKAQTRAVLAWQPQSVQSAM